jgi:elongation factor 1 alpha-like protein
VNRRVIYSCLAGHVDHGKSTLMGRLLLDLNVINEKTINKFKRDADKIGKGSFALAWVLDATIDERERGITVDTATRSFETEKTKFTILDAPGHQDFIPNMIAGASQADFAVLVIDAGTNSFESGLRGQTKEHAILVRSIGVQRLIVAVNKMDKADWSEERFNEIKQELGIFLTTANFSSSSVSYIPCAGLTGENITKRPTSPSASWYTGPTLVEELDAANPAPRAISKPLRMTLDEVIRATGTSHAMPTVSGRIESGSIQVGDEVLIQPSSQTATIKAIEEHDNPRDWAVAGQMVTLRLVHIDAAHVHAGDVLCGTTDAVQNAQRFTAKILAFEHVLPMFVEVHRGRLHVSGKVAKLVALLDKSTGQVGRKNPKVVQPGAAARVEIELELPTPMEAGWKVILRAEGKSVAAGIVE